MIKYALMSAESGNGVSEKLGGMKFGNSLRELRGIAGISQAELARRADLDPGYISRVERGVYRSPRLPTIRRISEALGLDDEQNKQLISLSGRTHLSRNQISERFTIDEQGLWLEPLINAAIIARRQGKISIARLVLQTAIQGLQIEQEHP